MANFPGTAVLQFRTGGELAWSGSSMKAIKSMGFQAPGLCIPMFLSFCPQTFDTNLQPSTMFAPRALCPAFGLAPCGGLKRLAVLRTRNELEAMQKKGIVDSPMEARICSERLVQLAFYIGFQEYFLFGITGQLFSEQLVQLAFSAAFFAELRRDR